MGKTIRYNEWDDEIIDRKEMKKIRKEQRKIRKEKEDFINSGFEREVEESN